LHIQDLYRIYLQYPNVQTDTRKLRKDQLFFALKGENFNGNLFAAQAIENGAAYVIIDEDVHVRDDHRYIRVDDALQTLQELALHHRKQFGIPFIAITGSNGKTTTKELMTAVLQEKYTTYSTEGNLNNHIGVPLTILKIKTDAEMAVVEMGANHLHEIEGYCKIALPTHGIITNCGKAHLEGFGSEEGVRKGKGELYDFLRANDGTVFRNADLHYLKEMAAGIAKQITYGNAEAKYIGSTLFNEVFLKMAVLTTGAEAIITTNLAGDFNFPNVMTAIAIGLHFGISIDNIKSAIENYVPDNSRSQFLEIETNQVILDAYNANPTSMQAAIKNFASAEMPSKILWLGAMKEMGKKERKEHQDLVDFVANYNWEEVILVGREFEAISGKFRWFETSALAADYVRENKPQNAAILIKGSRGSKMEFMLDALRD
jgi:UDP-N-acetylmuramoyl-tripeptide--D-alanyl-D-alanine ligase